MISSVYCYRSSTTPRQNTSLFPEFNGNLGSVPPTLPLTVTNLLTSPPRHWAVAPRLAMSQWRKCHTTPLPGGTKLCRNIATPIQLHSGQPYPDSPATSRQRRRCHRQLPAKSPRHHHSIRTSGSQLLPPSPNRAGLSKDEELQLSWQVLFTVTKNPGTTNIIPYKIQVYQWQYMYNNTFHNKNHLTTSSYCVQMPWHQLSQQLGRRHLLTNHHISFKFFSMTKHQGTGRLAWNRHFKANLPWEKVERNHKSITHNLSVKSLHCPKHWLVAGLATSHCLTQWMDTELTTLRIPNLPMQA